MTALISRAPKRAFVQGSKYTDAQGCYLSDSCRATALALRALGYTVETFTPTNLPATRKVNPNTPVKGDTACVKYIYERAFPGVIYPNFDVPKPLLKFARRKIVHTTLGEVRAQHQIAPFDHYTKFVKPSVQAKLFKARCARYAGWAPGQHPRHPPGLPGLPRRGEVLRVTVDGSHHRGRLRGGHGPRIPQRPQEDQGLRQPHL